MNRAILSFAAIALAASIGAPSAKAALWTYDLFPYTGASSHVRVTVDDAINANKLTVFVDVIANPNIGDIRAVFFNTTQPVISPNFKGINIYQAPPFAATDVTGADVTDVQFDTDNMGGGGNLIPSPTGDVFDVGVEIGTSGMTPDDIQSTMFVIDTHLGGDDLFEFGVRLTSVGIAGGDRSGSSKLFDGDEPTPTPEPGTIALLATGLSTAIAWRKRRRR